MLNTKSQEPRLVADPALNGDFGLITVQEMSLWPRQLAQNILRGLPLNEQQREGMVDPFVCTIACLISNGITQEKTIRATIEKMTTRD
jgi:hypothetical protein